MSVLKQGWSHHNLLTTHTLSLISGDQYSAAGLVTRDVRDVGVLTCLPSGGEETESEDVN